MNAPNVEARMYIITRKKQQIVCRDCGAIFEEMAPEREKKFEKAHDQG